MKRINFPSPRLAQPARPFDRAAYRLTLGERYVRSTQTSIDRATVAQEVHQDYLDSFHGLKDERRIETHEKALVRARDDKKRGKDRLAVYRGKLPATPEGKRISAVFRELRDTHNVAITTASREAAAEAPKAKPELTAKAIAQAIFERISKVA